MKQIPKCVSGEKSSRRRAPWAQTPTVQIHPQVVLKRTKAVFFCEWEKSDSHWEQKHHMQEHTFRKRILILKHSPLYELKLNAIENCPIQSGLSLNTVLWKRTGDKSKRHTGINKAFQTSHDH